MGLQALLARCDAVRSRSMDVPPERRRESDVLNVAVALMLESQVQRDAIAAVCRRLPIVKPFVMMLLRSYVDSDAGA